jgi:hypothetical protein
MPPFFAGPIPPPFLISILPLIKCMNMQQLPLMCMQGYRNRCAPKTFGAMSSFSLCSAVDLRFGKTRRPSACRRSSRAYLHARTVFSASTVPCPHHSGLPLSFGLSHSLDIAGFVIRHFMTPPLPPSPPTAARLSKSIRPDQTNALLDQCLFKNCQIYHKLPNFN